MPSFTLDGVSYEYDHGDPGDPTTARSWEYGHYPRIIAEVPLIDGTSVPVYAHAQRWTTTHVLASWEDDDRRPHWAWIPAGKVRRVTDSEWDIWGYHRCPENLRGIRWGNRAPGYAPE